MKRSIVGLILISTIFVTSCGDDETGGDTSGFDRKGMLTDLSDNIIIPSYDSLHKKVQLMNNDLSAFVASPDLANLASARASFEGAYHAWQRISYLEIGPAFNVLLRSSVNSFPADKNSIEVNITNENYDLTALSSQDEKGFPAIGYLLYGIGSTDTEIIEKYTTDANAANRLTYLEKVYTEIGIKISEVTAAWKTDGENYRQTFIDQDGTDIGSSIGLLINEVTRYIEADVRDEKIGIPLGKRSQGIPIPAEVEAGYSELSISLATENLKALHQFYLGKGSNGDQVSFYDYLIALNAKYNGEVLADVIAGQFEKSIAAVSAIPEPYGSTVVNNPAAAEQAYTELQKLTILFKVDMSSALGVLITYQDNDGD